MAKAFCCKQDVNDAEVDFPFRVSPSEQYIIENDPDPPCSIVLVGRSGTGKTTCAVFRMWARWLTFHHHSTEPFHQVWATATVLMKFLSTMFIDRQIFILKMHSTGITLIEATESTRY